MVAVLDHMTALAGPSPAGCCCCAKSMSWPAPCCSRWLR